MVDRVMPGGPSYRSPSRPTHRAFPGYRPYAGHGPGDYVVEGRSVVKQTPQYVRLSGSAEGWVPPVVFGTRVLTGQLILAYTPDDGINVYLAFAIAEGPVASVSNVQLNGESVSGLSWVTASETHLGGYSQSASSLLTGAISGHVEAWPGLAYIVLHLNGRNADVGSGMNVSAEVTGADLYDFRTASTAPSANPILEAYEILTNSEIWLGPARYAFDTTSWAAAADWCDDAMSDGSARFECHIALDPSDGEHALETVLSHAHARLVVADGTFYMAQDRALTPRALHIRARDWVSEPSLQELPRQSRPNTVMVRYHRDDGYSDPVVTAETGAVAAGDDPVVLQAVCQGFKLSTMAFRWAGQRLNVLTTETLTVSGVVGPIGADLIPGDAIYVSTLSGLDDQAARIESVQDRGDGTYAIRCRTGALTDDSSVLAEDATSGSGNLWITGAPGPPTGVTASAEYGEVGDGVGAARISVSWTAPTSGVVVDHYEVEADSKLVASVPSPTVTARFYTNKTGDVAISVYSVSPSGVRSTAGTTSISISTVSARVTKVQGRPWAATAPGTYAGYRADSAGTMQPEDYPYSVWGTFVSFAAGVGSVQTSNLPTGYIIKWWAITGYGALNKWSGTLGSTQRYITVSRDDTTSSQQASVICVIQKTT